MLKSEAWGGSILTCQLHTWVQHGTLCNFCNFWYDFPLAHHLSNSYCAASLHDQAHHQLSSCAFQCLQSTAHRHVLQTDTDLRQCNLQLSLLAVTCSSFQSHGLGFISLSQMLNSLHCQGSV